MDEGCRVVVRAARVASAARPRPPSSLGDDTPCGVVTARVLPDEGGGLVGVLIADDDADTADSLALLLRIWGHKVWTAYAGPKSWLLLWSTCPARWCWMSACRAWTASAWRD